MKILAKTIVAILFSLLLVQVMVGINKQSPLNLGQFGMVMLCIVAAVVYLFIFERKKKKN